MPGRTTEERGPDARATKRPIGKVLLYGSCWDEYEHHDRASILAEIIAPAVAIV